MPQYHWTKEMSVRLLIPFEMEPFELPKNIAMTLSEIDLKTCEANKLVRWRWQVGKSKTNI
jgi:hypothetical protein